MDRLGTRSALCSLCARFVLALKRGGFAGSALLGRHGRWVVLALVLVLCSLRAGFEARRFGWIRAAVAPAIGIVARFGPRVAPAIGIVAGVGRRVAPAIGSVAGLGR